MAKMFFAAVVGSLALATSAFAAHQPSVVYGQDNRMEVYEVPDAMVREMADSTVALIPSDRCQVSETGDVTIKGKNYGTGLGLCSNEPFYTQPTAANC